tara:strand:+ start:10146 stop:10532 length:387 start_codon:yes stop_codon:yes gene_type:complete
MNESIAAVPNDVADPQVLRSFLLRLIEELDLVLGFRGNDGLVRQSELTNAEQSITQVTGTTLAATALALAELTEVVSNTIAEVEDGETGVSEQLADLTTRVEDLETLTAVHTAELLDHETRITALENP